MVPKKEGYQARVGRFGLLRSKRAQRSSWCGWIVGAACAPLDAAQQQVGVTEADPVDRVPPRSNILLASVLILPPATSRPNLRTPLFHLQRTAPVSLVLVFSAF